MKMRDKDRDLTKSMSSIFVAVDDADEVERKCNGTHVPSDADKSRPHTPGECRE